ncbi:MAG: hypothetical protein M3R48_08180 [Candidatus Dormibacteraeota bacterium]|nr:hypothetical protein [Candidatus Dormibacteraeota bacterium]
MRHLTDGLLRRLHDDRFAASNEERAHLAQCDRCARRMASVGDDATTAATLLARPTGDGVAVEPALGRIRNRLAADGGSRAPGPAAPWIHARRRWAAGALAAAAATGALVATAGAAGWLSIFSPTEVAPVTLTASDLNGLPDLSAYGHMRVNQPATQQVADAAHAAAASGLHVLQPGALPAGVPTAVSWEVLSAGSATFTLDAATANAAAQRAGRSAPQVPANLDGTTVTVNAGPAVVAVYGAGASATGAGDFSSLPTLVIAESIRPTASTNGASLQQLERFLLAQPGLSPQLAAEIRAIGQPASTLPIPVIAGLMTSQTVTIDGVQGVAAGDSTGLGAAVVWEKDGVVYAVGGLLPQSEVLDIARSLH